MEASSRFLKPCAAKTTKEGESSKLAEPMEVSSSLVVNGEIEQGSDEKPKIEEPEADVPEILQAPEWDVDSFDGLEYYSSAEEELSSPLSDEDVAVAHYNIDKRQLIDSKVYHLSFLVRMFGKFMKLMVALRVCG